MLLSIDEFLFSLDSLSANARPHSLTQLRIIVNNVGVLGYSRVLAAATRVRRVQQQQRYRQLQGDQHLDRRRRRRCPSRCWRSRCGRTVLESSICKRNSRFSTSIRQLGISNHLLGLCVGATRKMMRGSISWIFIVLGIRGDIRAPTLATINVEACNHFSNSS